MFIWQREEVGTQTMKIYDLRKRKKRDEITMSCRFDLNNDEEILPIVAGITGQGTKWKLFF